MKEKRYQKFRTGSKEAALKIIKRFIMVPSEEKRNIVIRTAPTNFNLQLPTPPKTDGGPHKISKEVGKAGGDRVSRVQ